MTQSHEAATWRPMPAARPPVRLPPRSQVPSSDDASHIVRQVRRIVRAINVHSQNLSREAGLTVPQLLLLRQIQEAPPGRATAGALCALMDINPPTMSGLVDRLGRLGLIQRQRSPEDRRVVELALTPLGLQTLDQAPPLLQDRVLARLNGLSADQRTRVLDALDLIVALMDAEDLDASAILAPGPSILVKD